jgi:arabinogalactan oligomer/maltooligosaccharide transport system substrate-binding protein
MKKAVVVVLALLMTAAMIMAGGQGETTAEGPVTITLWTKEGEADNALQWVYDLAEEFNQINAKQQVEVVKPGDVEALREDFQTASLAGTAPELLWTVNDHAGPFTAADLIQPVDGLFDLSKYVDSALAAVKLDGKTWGVPINNGNHLMLLYNKDLVPQAPADTNELFRVAQQLTTGDRYGLVWNQTEPFWMVPWLGGFGGSVFSADGVTPTLDTKAMRDTLQFLYDMKYKYKIIPKESDYNGADSLFKEGKAAMIINGDWSLGAYKEIFGDNLGIARIPKVSSTGKWPAPYTSGVFFMVPKEVSGAKLEVVKAFVGFVTNEENQVEMVRKLNRLPALKVALDEPVVKSDLFLEGSADQMVVGTPMPTVLEMRCNWDSMKPEMQAVLSDTKSPAEAAAAMQRAAEACVKTLE